MVTTATHNSFLKNKSLFLNRRGQKAQHKKKNLLLLVPNFTQLVAYMSDVILCVKEATPDRYLERNAYKPHILSKRISVREFFPFHIYEVVALAD